MQKLSTVRRNLSHFNSSSLQKSLSSTNQLNTSSSPSLSYNPQRYFKAAMILSGCGYLDGTETQEAVSMIVNLSKIGADITYMSSTRF